MVLRPRGERQRSFGASVRLGIVYLVVILTGSTCHDSMLLGVSAIRDAALAAGAPLVLDLEEKTYLRDDEPIRMRQCVVQDPDGYLLRFSELL